MKFFWFLDSYDNTIRMITILCHKFLIYISSVSTLVRSLSQQNLSDTVASVLFTQNVLWTCYNDAVLAHWKHIHLGVPLDNSSLFHRNCAFSSEKITPNIKNMPLKPKNFYVYNVDLLLSQFFAFGCKQMFLSLIKLFSGKADDRQNFFHFQDYTFIQLNKKYRPSQLKQYQSRFRRHYTIRRSNIEHCYQKTRFPLCHEKIGVLAIATLQS